jgi:hypothetical protein
MKNSRRMLMRVLFTTLLLFVAAGTALAQDLVNVSSETHRVLLENAQVGAMDVRVKPGEKVGMHSHLAGILYYLSDAKLKVTASLQTAVPALTGSRLHFCATEIGIALRLLQDRTGLRRVCMPVERTDHDLKFDVGRIIATAQRGRFDSLS